MRRHLITSNMYVINATVRNRYVENLPFHNVVKYEHNAGRT